jgi:hypothetical protein
MRDWTGQTQAVKLRRAKSRIAIRLISNGRSSVQSAGQPAPQRIFLLSPANAGGERARLVLSDRAEFDLAQRLRTGRATLGEVFAFISGLYFRGKLEYAQAFARAPEGMPGSFIIVAGRGLLPPETVVTLADLRTMASVPVDAADERYRAPLERESRRLAGLAGPHCEFVLLGSVSSMKYLGPLCRVFGDQLLFPADFVGRGDMSRGGLLLRQVKAGTELAYKPAGNEAWHGPRPPKLPRNNVAE